MSPINTSRNFIVQIQVLLKSERSLRLILAKHSNILHMGLIMRDLEANHALGFQSIPNSDAHT